MINEPEHSANDVAASPAAQCPGIGEQAESKLRRSAYLALKQLSCEFREGILTLRGRLPSYYLKQVAQTVVACVEGVDCVVNQIEVVAHANSPAPRQPEARDAAPAAQRRSWAEARSTIIDRTF